MKLVTLSISALVAMIGLAAQARVGTAEYPRTDRLDDLQSVEVTLKMDLPTLTPDQNGYLFQDGKVVATQLRFASSLVKKSETASACVMIVPNADIFVDKRKEVTLQAGQNALVFEPLFTKDWKDHVEKHITDEGESFPMNYMLVSVYPAIDSQANKVDLKMTCAKKGVDGSNTMSPDDLKSIFGETADVQVNY